MGLQNGPNFTRQYLPNQYSDFTEISQTIQGPDRPGTISPLFHNGCCLPDKITENRDIKGTNIQISLRFRVTIYTTGSNFSIFCLVDRNAKNTADGHPNSNFFRMSF